MYRAHMSLPFKRHLDPLIRFRMAYAAYSLYFAINLLAMPLPKLLLPLVDPTPHLIGYMVS